MPSPPRDVTPGFHHVWVNATGNWDYFLDELDRMIWVRRLVQVTARFKWKCLAFCQMSTHVHVLVGVDDSSLSAGMRDLNREYSRDFNLRHERVGTFVRDRFGSRRIEDGRDLLGTGAYVYNNPVRAGACAQAAEWAPSSFRTTIGVSRDFPFVDAGPLISEAGSVEALHRLVLSRAADRPKGTRPEPGSGRVL